MAHVVINDTTPRATFAVGATPTSGPFVLTADFVVFDPSTDIEVFNGTTLLTYSATPVNATQWSFTGTLIDGGYQGGSISLGGTVSNTTIVVNRKVKIARSNDFPFPSATLDIKGLNTALDKLFAIEQDTKLRNQFALSQPSSDTAIIGQLPAKSVRASNFLGFDAAGDPTTLTAVGTAPAAASTYLKRNAANTAFDAKTPGEVATDVGISAYGKTLVDDADAATARTTLGLGTAATENTPIAVAKGGTGATTAAAARAGLAAAGTADANIFTADQTIQSADAGAGLGPLLVLDRNSASPLAGDLLGSIEFNGRDSGAASQLYGRIFAKIDDATAGSEDSEINLNTFIAGVETTVVAFRQGILVGNPTGGDKGAGTINASAIYDDGVLLGPGGIFTAYFESAQQTITAAGALTIAHGLGGAPKGFEVLLKCVTAEGGYSAGDLYYEFQTSGGLASQGVAVTPDATNLNVRYGSLASVFQLKDKTTGAGFNITLANWKCIFRAWL